MSELMPDPRLAAMQDIAAAYSKLRALDDAKHWQNLELSALRPSLPRCLTPEVANIDAQELAKAGAKGWLRYQSGVCRVDSDAAEILTDAGALIAGEWLLHDGQTSIHLRPHPQHPGMLGEWRYSERPLDVQPALEKGEVPVLRERVVVLAHPIERNGRGGDGLQSVLLYNVLWGASDQRDPYKLRRLCARFLGFYRQDRVVDPNGRGLLD